MGIWLILCHPEQLAELVELGLDERHLVNDYRGGSMQAQRVCSQRSQFGILTASQSIAVGGSEIDRVLSYASDASK